MKKILLTLCCALLALSPVAAQTLTWNDIINGIDETGGNRPDCISIFPVDNNTIIGGTSFGIYKSTNNGTNWSLVSTNYFTAHQIIKTNSGKLVAAGRGFISFADKPVLVSSDNGSTWNGVVVDATQTGLEIRDVVKDNSGNLYAAVYGSVASTGVYKSTDEGSTWTKQASGGLPSGVLFVGATYSEDGNTVLLGTNKGISKSTDGGATFTTGNVSDYFYRIRKTANGTILASGDDGIYASTDTGGTFTKVISTSSFVFDFFVDGDAIVAGAYNAGVVKYNATTYVFEEALGTATNGLTSLRLRAVAKNAVGDYFAATDANNNETGRKFHTTVAGGSVGINDAPKAIAFSMFPNPSNSSVTLYNVPAGAGIKLLDASGKLVYATTTADTQQTIDVTDFTKGLYFVQVQSVNGIGIQKLVITE